MNIFEKLSLKIKTRNFERNTILAYKSFNQNMIKQLYPGGKKQSIRVVSSIGVILNEEYTLYDKAKCLGILNIYNSIMIRKLITESEDDLIRLSLLINAKEIVNEDNVDKIMAFVFMMTKNKDLIIDDDNLEIIILFSKQLKDNRQAREINEKNSKKYVDDEDYGLVVSKPIFTNNVEGSNRYLEKLKTEKGENLTWQRMCTWSSKNVEGIIDEYSLYLPSGDLYKKIYINMYSKSNSTYIPKGFLAID